MELSRRSLCQTLPLLIGSLADSSLAQSAAQSANNQPIKSFALPFDQMTPHTNNGNTARPILNGITHSGAHLEVHETTLAPGMMPHPPHHHAHEELFLLSI